MVPKRGNIGIPKRERMKDRDSKKGQMGGLTIEGS